MTALTTQTDTVSGWLLVAGCGFVAAVWVVLANYPRLSDWWADLRAPAKADRIIATGATFAHTLDAGQAEYAEHIADAKARIEMVTLANVLAQPDTLVWFPQQRQPYDHEVEGL